MSPALPRGQNRTRQRGGDCRRRFNVLHFVFRRAHVLGTVAVVLPHLDVQQSGWMGADGYGCAAVADVFADIPE